MPNKIDELILLVNDISPDLILLNEVIPKAQRHVIPPYKLRIPGYLDYSNFDKNAKNLGASGIRGTSAYYKQDLPVVDIDINTAFKEAVVVKVILQNDKALIAACLYRSPSSTIENSFALSSTIREISKLKPHRLAMVGDINFPDIDWETYTCPGDPENRTYAAEYKFIDTLQEEFLIQEQKDITRNMPNQKPAVLDLVITDKEGAIGDITRLPGLGRSDHDMLLFEVNCDPYRRPPPKPRPNYARGDYESIRQHIKDSNLTNLCVPLNVHESEKLISETIKTAVTYFVPWTKSSSFKGTAPCKKTKRLRRRKYQAWKVWDESHVSDDHKRYRKKCNDLRNFTRNKDRRKEKLIAQNAKNSLKAFWRYVNSKRCTPESIGVLERSDGSLATSNKEKAEILNNFFGSVFTQENITTLPTLTLDELITFPMPDTVITAEKVRDKFKSLNPNKSHGLDGIHPRVLIEAAEELAEPYADLYRKSLSSGEQPHIWKRANVTAIHKKCSKRVAAHYRPISVTCVPCKCLEFFVRTDLIEHCMRNDLLCDEQHGFVPGRSCLTQLIATLEHWTENIESGIPFDVVYTDFSKAFDSVAHCRLENKLKALQVNDTTRKWIMNLLSEREQRTVIEGSASSWIPVTSGIPQGSVIGPTLFAIFINDLPNTCTAPCKIYADDTKVYTKVSTPDDSESLQHDIDSLHEWSDSWQLPFNATKCKVMHIGHNNNEASYHMGNTQLETTKAEKDLGVLVDDKLSFRAHAAACVNKANRTLGLIKNSFYSRDKVTFKRLYEALVRPALEYANVVWGPRFKTDRAKFEKIQQRSINMIVGLNGTTYTEKLAELNLPTLSYRRLRGALIQTYKIFSGVDRLDPNTLFKQPMTKTEDLRGHHPYKIFRRSSKKNTRKYFYTQIVAKPWNALPREVVEAKTVTSFKVLVDRYYGYRRFVEHDF